LVFYKQIEGMVETHKCFWRRFYRYNNNLYDTNNGNQIIAVKRMVDKMTGFSIWADKRNILHAHLDQQSWPDNHKYVYKILLF
jgi:hypothetical protein